MGSFLSCDKCPTNLTSTVVNLSDAVVLRVADGIEEPKFKTECVSQEDCGWFEKIKCLDDAHSKQYGLFLKDIDQFLNSFEKRLNDGKRTEFIFTETLIRCYKVNPECPLKCFKERLEFIDSLDSKRLEKIRVAAEEYYLNKRKKKRICQ